MQEFSNAQIASADLPKIEDLTFTRLNRKLLTQILIFRIILSLGFAGFLVIFTLKNLERIPQIIWASSIGGAIIILLFMLVGYFGFFKKGFALREKDISYQRGLIFHKITTVPLSRIQHSELVRGPMDRMFGLSSVKIYTAGGSSSDVTIPGLTVEIAENIREYINSKIEKDADS